MNSKKAITLLVLATLLLSFVPIVPVSAISAPLTYQTDGIATKTTGVYDEWVLVNGTGVTSGNTINVYWDTVGDAHILNTTTGNPDGSFELWIKVPSAVQGNHYVWVKDSVSGQTAKSAAFTVNRKIKLSISEGLKDDTVTVSGYGYPKEVDVNLWLSNATITDNVTTAYAETAADGSWSQSFAMKDWVYGAYTVTGSEKISGAQANATFTIGPAITVSKSSGPAGTVLTVTGRGFAASTDLGESNFTLGNATYNAKMAIEDDDTVTTSADGGFTQTVIVPSLVAGEFTLSVTDATNTATASFEVTGETSITVSPGHGAPGTVVTVTGADFTNIAGSTLTFSVGGTGVSDAITVAADGSFEGTIILPALTLNTEHTVLVVDENGLNATAPVLVGIVSMLLSEYEGPVGSEVQLTATGLKGTGTYNVTFGDTYIFKAVAVGGTAIAKTFYIPSVEPGVYTVTLSDGGWSIDVSVDFTVTAGASLALTPTGGPNGYNISIAGDNFAELGGQTLKWWLSNSTDAWDVSGSVIYGGVAAQTNASGELKAYYMIPAGTGIAELDLGSYTLNVSVAATALGHNDGKIWAETTLNVVPEEWDISIKKSAYAVGDTITFNIRATFAKANSYLEITDPDGYTYWISTFTGAEWTKVGDWQTVPVGNQIADNSLSPFTLSEDAPTGTWSWKVVDAADETLEEGTFEVGLPEADVVAEQVEDLNQEIVDLAEQLTGVTGEISSVKDDVSDVAAIAEQAVAAAQAAADAVNAVAQTANTASQAADNAADAAEAAREAATGLTTLVYGAIGAALVAALAAIVSLMQISRRIAG